MWRSYSLTPTLVKEDPSCRFGGKMPGNLTGCWRATDNIPNQSNKNAQKLKRADPDPVSLLTNLVLGRHEAKVRQSCRVCWSLWCSNPIIAVSVRYRTAVILSAERQLLPPQLLHRVMPTDRTAPDHLLSPLYPLRFSRCIQLRHALKLRAPSIEPAILGSMVNS